MPTEPLSTERLEELARRLDDPQRKVLLSVGGYDDYGYYSFKHIAEKTGLTKDEVREAIHAMKPLDLVVYGTGLATDDGEFYGSGYAASDLGLNVADHIETAALRALRAGASQ